MANTKNKGGRPNIYDIEDIISKLEEYTNNTEEPLIQEFLLNYKYINPKDKKEYRLSKSRLYELKDIDERLSEAIARAITKQEIYILRNAGHKRAVDPQIAKLRLQSLDPIYKERYETKNIHTVEITKSADEIRQELKEKFGIEA